MAKAEDNALAIVQDQFPVLQADPHELMEIIAENTGGELNQFDLERIKVPAGGGIAWEVPTLDGEPDSQKVIEGIIVAFRDVRGYWPEKYDGSKNPPQCASEDGKFGVGNPGGECAKCPFSQFGSKLDDNGEPGKGQACKQMRLLLVILPGQLLPTVLVLPPTSIKSAKKYFLQLASRGIRHAAVTTKIGLKKDKSSDGIDYSQATFQLGTALSPELAEKMRAIADTLRPMFAAIKVDGELDDDTIEGEVV